MFLNESFAIVSCFLHGFLLFSPSRWWGAGILDMAFKLFLTAGLGVFFSGSQTVGAGVSAILCALIACYYMRAAPMRYYQGNYISMCSYISLVALYITAIVPSSTGSIIDWLATIIYWAPLVAGGGKLLWSMIMLFTMCKRLEVKYSAQVQRRTKNIHKRMKATDMHKIHVQARKSARLLYMASDFSQLYVCCNVCCLYKLLPSALRP